MCAQTPSDGYHDVMGTITDSNSITYEMHLAVSHHRQTDNRLKGLYRPITGSLPALAVSRFLTFSHAGDTIGTSPTSPSYLTTSTSP